MKTDDELLERARILANQTWDEERIFRIQRIELSKNECEFLTELQRSELQEMIEIMEANPLNKDI